MGVVYRAEHVRLRRSVALKLLLPELGGDERFRERFLRESRLAAATEHPGILPIYDAGEIDGVLYIAMRYVEGRDLGALLREQGALEVGRAVAVVSQLAQALDAAHARGLVHRDVKPSNALIAGDQVYLVDFGITRDATDGERLTQTGELVGTVDYLAPELIRGEEVDSRADVYSLGCVLYECLAGEVPFRRSSVIAALYAHLEEEPPRVGERRPDLPPELDGVIARALAKEAATRWPTCGDFATAAGAAVAPGGEEVGPGRAPRDAREAPPPELSDAVARTGRLPDPPTALYGRDRDLLAVAELVTSGKRLVTLLGPGGVGKTRLAIETARRVAGGFEDGVAWVELAPVADARETASAIAHALGIPLTSRDSPATALLRFLTDRRMLVVLDNVEHLLPATPLIGQILEQCRAIGVLLTSREPTRLAAERLYRVQPLEVPADSAVETHEDLERFGAVALFCDRARARDPEFALDEAGAGSVVAICRRLDGLPLALELAAARVGLLTSAELAGRLDRALGLLVGGARDAPARQQTLRATIDWSYGLLTGAERRAFAQMAVFAGGATVAAAEAVTGASLDTLDSLVAKQLLARRGDRLVMLETVREYALERLAADPERDALQQRLSARCLQLLREAAPHLVRSDRPRWLATLARELPNALAALTSAIDRRDGETALELVCAISDYWWHARTPFDNAVPYLDAALELARDAHPHLRAGALLNRARLTPVRQSDLAHDDLGQSLVEESIELYRACDDARGISACLTHLAWAAAWTGDYDRSATLSEEALRYAERTGDDVTIAAALASASWNAASFEDALRRAQEAMPYLRRVGDLEDIGHACVNIGYGAIVEGRYREALTWLDEGIEAARRLGDHYALFVHHNNRGLALLFLHELDEAERAFRAALTICVEAAAETVIDEALLGLAAVDIARGRLRRAAHLTGAAKRHEVRRNAAEDILWSQLTNDIVAPARTRHGRERWDLAEREGTTMATREAIEYALERGRSPR